MKQELDVPYWLNWPKDICVMNTEEESRVRKESDEHVNPNTMLYICLVILLGLIAAIQLVKVGVYLANL